MREQGEQLGGIWEYRRPKVQDHPQGVLEAEEEGGWEKAC